MDFWFICSSGKIRFTKSLEKCEPANTNEKRVSEWETCKALVLVLSICALFGRVYVSLNDAYFCEWVCECVRVYVFGCVFGWCSLLHDAKRFWANDMISPSNMYFYHHNSSWNHVNILVITCFYWRSLFPFRILSLHLFLLLFNVRCCMAGAGFYYYCLFDFFMGSRARINYIPTMTVCK